MSDPRADSVSSLTTESDESIVNFAGPSGIQNFYILTTDLNLEATKKRIEQIQTIHLDINEEWHDEYNDDLLAMAFTELNRYVRVSKTLKEIHIHVKGTFLFTKDAHVLTSPVAVTRTEESEPGHRVHPPVNSVLHRFLDEFDPPTVLEKYSLISKGLLTSITSPKAFLGPLLQLRDLDRVEITGPMEQGMQEEIIERVSRNGEAAAPSNLVAGEKWDYKRIPREEASNDAYGGSPTDDWGMVVPTHPSNRVVVGWRIESEE